MIDEKLQLIRSIYRRMPGAKMPPKWGGRTLWAEVEDTDHWKFCEDIAEQWLASVLRATQLTAKETVKRMREEVKADAIPSADDWADDFDPERLAELADDAAEAAIGVR